VGVNAERYPGLVRRIVNEGHEIGNHTYYHPNLALCWPEHIRLELNATQLLLETITGHATTLFRPPYAADTSPSRLSSSPLKIAEISIISWSWRASTQRIGKAGCRHHFASGKTTAARWQHHLAPRRRRRSFPDGRSFHLSGLAATKGDTGAFKHTAGHHARRVMPREQGGQSLMRFVKAPASRNYPASKNFSGHS
jgi:hypothetical protein